VVGTVAGGYPSLHLSKPQPTATLKGIAKIGGNNALTRTLVVFQFGLSIFLITGALGMATQLRFMMTKDIGLNLKNVIDLAGISTQSSFPDYRADRDLVERLRTRLKSNPDIVACSWAAGSPGWNFFRSFQYHGETKKVIMLRADEEYLGIFGLQLIEGRNFIAGSADDRENGMIVNETFAREMGWSSPVVGNYLTDVDDTTLAGLRIIGVVKDAHFSSLHNSIQPLIISQHESWRANALLLRVVPTRIAEIMAYLKNVWKEIVPDKPFSGYFADELFQDQYADDEKWTTIIEYATVLAVVLACLGLFGLATLSAANRTKEIGIRKVLGASVSGIVELLARDFVKLVLVANVIAWPIAYFALNRWLQNFAYRIDLSWLLFLLSGGLAVLIALLTVSTQAIKAALANPVEALRYE
jgi:putative ABC transport system permease protein